MFQWLPKILKTHLDARASESQAKRERAEGERLAAFMVAERQRLERELAAERARLKRLEVDRSRNRKLTFILFVALLIVAIGWLVTPSGQIAKPTTPEVKTMMAREPEPQTLERALPSHNPQPLEQVDPEPSHSKTRRELGNPRISAPITKPLIIDPRPDAPQTHIGPRGGRYHYSKNGKKVYEHKR